MGFAPDIDVVTKKEMVTICHRLKLGSPIYKITEPM